MIAKLAVAIDPGRAQGIAMKISDQTLRESALADIARTTAATDPDSALAIAETITYEDTKISALTGMAQAMSTTHPERAALLTSEAEKIARPITDPMARATALASIAEALGADDKL